MKKRHFGLIGFPVGHTMSPFIHGELFRLAGIDADYTVFSVSPEGLAQPEEKERLLGLDGFNVTIPHKQAVTTLLGKIDEKAAAFSSVKYCQERERMPLRLHHRRRGLSKVSSRRGNPHGREKPDFGQRRRFACDGF
ncbi:MAG: hypothetical protein ACLSWS_15605 [Faecalispora jeddahensis]